MRIKFTNSSGPLKVHHSILLVQGCIENYSQDIWQRHGDKSFMLLYHQTGEERRVCEEVRLTGLTFKLLVRLYPGTVNLLTFDFLGVKDTLSVSYVSPEVMPKSHMLKPEVGASHVVRLVYIVCKGSNGSFQGPEGEDCSQDSAKTRIKLGGELLQCFMCESLREEGEGRKTFQLELDSNGSPVCHIHYTGRSMEETWAMSGEELWSTFARELMASSIGDNKSKYLAFLSSTRYSCPTPENPPTTHQEILKLTKGHVALGGGGLALFGTGALWTWPTSLARVQTRLVDLTPVDSGKLMDDSAYRGTVGGCYATTLGSVLHELGHCFGLGHTAQGIMARGFDTLDQYFTLPSSNSGVVTTKPRPLASLQPCSLGSGRGHQPRPHPPSTTSTGANNTTRFTSVRRSDSISQYLENYAQKRLQQREQDHSCYWTRSCAVLLSNLQWMKEDNSNTCSQQAIHLNTNQDELESCCPIAVVEIRGENGLVLDWWEPPETSTPTPHRTHIHQQLETAAAAGEDEVSVVAITGCGAVLKQTVNHP